jgi:hypothetical protein
MTTTFDVTDFFRVAQEPSLWLLFAERLAGAAEVILRHESKLEPGFSAALKIATREAEQSAEGIAEVAHDEPNYLPGMLLYGYAIENVVKALMIARDRTLISSSRIDEKIKKHDLVELCASAGMSISDQQRSTLEMLSRIVEWAGRYPVAGNIKMQDQVGAKPVEYGDMVHWHEHGPIIRSFFEETKRTLESMLPKLPSRHGSVVILK